MKFIKLHYEDGVEFLLRKKHITFARTTTENGSAIRIFRRIGWLRWEITWYICAEPLCEVERQLNS